MDRLVKVIGAAVAAAGAGATLAAVSRRRSVTRARDAYRDILDSVPPPSAVFEARMVDDLPEIAQRYFRHAIAPGTPIYSAVELEMSGTFLLGDKDKFQSFTMAAREALDTRGQFVWMPRMRSDPVTITGFDALVAGEAWTRFWLLGLFPVANARSSPDLVRSALFRAVGEAALWLPTALLPDHGVEWHQTGENEARVVMKRLDPPIEMTLTLAPSGAVLKTSGQRWSNANEEQRFRLQPFGGTISSEANFQGITISSGVEIGNHFGTPNFLPFFQARIQNAWFS